MKLYSTSEAASYLGMSPQGVKYHLYQSKHLTGMKIGNSIVFTQQELDDFKAAGYVRRDDLKKDDTP